jgi:PTH1 family peptidyl-tRNA hydrolase
MKLIAGLGNIGDKYCFTRHNAGFMMIDRWTLSENMNFKQDTKLKSFITRLKYNGEDILFIKPTTFMNLSGEAVRAVMDYYKIPVSDIIIVYDDIALPIGKIRLRANGSDGGHNGIKSIIQHIGTSNFNRIKIGIGPQIGASEHYVLQNFSKEQLDILKEVLDKSINAAKSIMTDGIEKSQNKFN